MATKTPFKIKCSTHTWGREGSVIKNGKMAHGKECRVCGAVSVSSKK